MVEIFDMGKYDFYVWGSVGIFIVAVLIDFISASQQHNNIKKQIKAQIKRTNAQKAVDLNNKTKRKQI